KRIWLAPRSLWDSSADRALQLGPAPLPIMEVWTSRPARAAASATAWSPTCGTVSLNSKPRSTPDRPAAAGAARRQAPGRPLRQAPPQARTEAARPQARPGLRPQGPSPTPHEHRRRPRGAAAAVLSRLRRPVVETHVALQYQVEIPRRPIHRQFNVHVGR